MPISYVEMFHPPQQDAVGQILAGGANALSGAINNSVQLGRDMVNLRASQEREYLTERGRNEELNQRRGEFFINQLNTERKFKEDVFQKDRDFEYGVKTDNRKFLFDAFKDSRDYALHAADVDSAIVAREDTADFHAAQLENQAEINRVRALTGGTRGADKSLALEAWAMGEGPAPAELTDPGAVPAGRDPGYYNNLFNIKPTGSRMGGGAVIQAPPATAPLPGPSSVVAPVAPAAPVAPGAATATRGLEVPPGVNPNDDPKALKLRIKTLETRASLTADPNRAAQLADRAAQITTYAERKQGIEKKVQTVQNIETRMDLARKSKGVEKLGELTTALDSVANLLGVSREEVLANGRDAKAMRKAADRTGLDISDDDIGKFIKVATEYRAAAGEKPELTPNLFVDVEGSVSSAIRGAFKSSGLTPPPGVVEAAAKAAATKAAAVAPGKEVDDMVDDLLNRAAKK